MQTRSLFSNKHAVPLLALLCCTLWASAVVYVRDGYKLLHIPTSDIGSMLMFAGIRFLLAGLIIVGVLSLVKKKLCLPAPSELGMIAKLACFQTIGQYFFYYIGLAHATGVTGSLMQGIAVFVGVLVSCLVFRLEKLTYTKILGCILGFIGLYITSGQGLIPSSFSLQGEGLLLIAASLGSTGTVLIRKFSQSMNPVKLAGWQFMLGGFILTVIGIMLGGSLSISLPAQFAVTAWLILVSSVAYGVWSQLLKYNDVSHVLIYKFSIPIIGVILSLMVLGPEGADLGPHTFIGLAFISIGIIVVQRSNLLGTKILAGSSGGNGSSGNGSGGNGSQQS